MRRTFAAVAIVGTLVVAGCGSEETDTAAGGELPKLPAAAAARSGRDTAAASSAELMLYPAQQIEYRVADDAKAPASSAMAYRYIPDEPDSGRIRKLAEALGVGAADVRIDTGQLVFWHYNRDPEGSVSSDIAVACAPDGKCPEPPPQPVVEGVPSAPEAETKARGLLEKAGIDAGTVTETADDPTNRQPMTRTVSFVPELDGVEVHGVYTTFTFGEHGRLESASGWFGDFEEVGVYDLVGLDKAVERLGTGFGAGARDGVATMEAQPGSTLPPQIVEITGARVVLNIVVPMCPGDPVYAVPAFAFEPDRAGSVNAVQEGDLEPPEGGSRAPKARCPGDEPGKPEPMPLPPDAGQTEPAPPVSEIRKP